jgi:hypothetical protein
MHFNNKSYQFLAYEENLVSPFEIKIQLLESIFGILERPHFLHNVTHVI